MTRGGARPPETVREVHRRLNRAYGPLEPPRRLDPIEELIFTILSQNTKDVNRDRAYTAMRSRYPTWGSLATAGTRDLVRCIRVGGLANTKAPRILGVLREIRAREGGYALDWMYDASDEEVAAYLMTLPGVGPKTAACVLAFSLGRPALPVDTHVHRVATRLGFLPAGTTSGRAHALLTALVPPRIRVPHARRPDPTRPGSVQGGPAMVRELSASGPLPVGRPLPGHRGGSKGP